VLNAHPVVILALPEDVAVKQSLEERARDHLVDAELTARI